MTKAEFIKIFGEKDGNKLYKLLNSKCNNFCTFWKKTGNSGTNPLTNFLGTTDNVDLVFKTNSTESFRIFKTTQNIGINTTVDNGFKLNINGNLRVNNGFYVAAPDTLTSDYITGVLKLPQVTIEAVNRSNLSLRMLIRAGGWHTSTWFGAETMPNWVNNGGGNATQNAAFGWGALRYLTTGQNNTATGAFALAGNSLGSTGSNNTGCGYDAAWLISTASQITAVGSTALGDLTTGNNNVGLGYNSGRGVTTGINNTIIGANITGLTANLSDTLIIATGAGGTASYRIFSPSSGNILIGTTTDAGYKLDVFGTSRIRSAASGLDSNLLIESSTNEKFALLSLKSGSGSTWALGACNYQFSNAFIIRSGAIGTERFAIFPTTGNVLIGTTTDVASSILTLSSTTKGFLPPRMTTTQRDAIVSPATGLVLFNTTTDTLQVRASTGWINL
jgi:hypothetical protein